MSEDKDTGGAQDPEDRGEGGGKEEEGDPYHEETGVKVLLGHSVVADLHRFGSPLVDPNETSDKEANRDEEEGIHDHGVDREHGDDDYIVAREIARVVCDALSRDVEAFWLRYPCEVEEFGGRAERA